MPANYQNVYFQLPQWKGIIAVSRGGLFSSGCIGSWWVFAICETVCIASYHDHNNQGELQVLHAAQVPNGGEGFIVVDDLVDTGNTARAIRQMYPNAKFVTVFAKPAGAELVDDYVIDIPQNTWIEQPWDLGLTFVPPLSRK